MRLARALTAYNQHDPAIDSLAAAAELDVLQLDYHWYAEWTLDASHCELDSRSYAPGLLQQLRGLHKTLYLEPRLRIITNAGGGNTIGCLESLGQFLSAQGDADLPITAIRGENVLPRIEEFLAEGLELKNSVTAAPLTDLRRPLLAAQIQLGAGTFTTALDEGSRLVVAGCYDPTTPFIAAGVSHFQWDWNFWDALAGAAMAAHLAPSLAAAELHNDGSATLASSAHDELPSTDGSLLHHADVCCETAALQLSPTDYGQLHMTGTTGSQPSGQWRLPLIYDAGYCSTVFFELRGAQADELSDSTFDVLQTLVSSNESHRHVTIQRLQSVLEDPGQSNRNTSYLRIFCNSLQREPCEQFLRDIANFSVRHQSAVLGVSGPPPTIQQKTDIWWTQVPREAVDLSVDTRLAKQWM